MIKELLDFKLPIDKLIFDLNKCFFKKNDLINKTEDTKNILNRLLQDEGFDKKFLSNILNLIEGSIFMPDNSLEKNKIAFINELSGLLNRDYITINDILSSEEEQIKVLYNYFVSNLNHTENIEKILFEESFYEKYCFTAIAVLKFNELNLDNTIEDLQNSLNTYTFELINSCMDDYYLFKNKKREMDNNLIELIRINKELKNENRNVKKELEGTNRYIKTEITQLINSNICKNLNKFNSVLDNCVKDIKNANYKTLKNSYESLLSQSEEKNTNNRMTILKKNNEIKALKQVQLTEDDILNYIKINNKNFKLKNKIVDILNINDFEIEAKEELINIDNHNCTNKTIEGNIRNNCSEKKDYLDLNGQKLLIGYCKIENGIHYTVLRNDNKIEINNIPKGLYLGDGQFVQISENGNFIKNYDYYIPDTSDFNILSDSLLVEINTEIEDHKETYYTVINGERIDIQSSNSEFIIYNNSVGVINKNNLIVRLFKKFKYNIDSLINSIESKNHAAYFVLSTTEKTITVRDILTNEITIYDKFFNYNREIVPLSTLILDKEKNIISMFSATKFYTTSSFYKNKKYVSVKLNNEKINIYDCITGEKVDVILNINKDKLSNELLYLIDEYGNVIDMISDNGVELLDIEKKCKKQKVIYYNENTPIKIKKNVLIVGDKGFENTYKINLYKYGYIVKVIDGFDSWKKIQMGLKNIDVVIAVPNYMSHDNFYKIKDTLIDTDVIISAYDGANRLADLLEEKYEKVI